jgi:DNA polymerase-3 subunit delta'
VSRKAPAGEETLPGAEEAHALAAGLAGMAAAPEHAAVISCLRSLAASPPQALLLEGGSAREREAVAFYWAALLNCPAAAALPSAGPCLACPVCLRLLTRMHRDLFFLDGGEGSIKIEEVRDMRAVLGEAPREARKRVVILAEAQSLTEAAANALLKSLEEPGPHTVFALLAPQRERLLPTLVSRSWVLTLAWPDPHAADPGSQSEEWEAALNAFLRNGRGLLERTSARGSVDASVARSVLGILERALALALAGRAQSSLARFFAELPPRRQRMADLLLSEAQESLSFTVNPTLVVEWLAAHLFLLKPRP